MSFILIEQIIVSILQNYVNPLFEPIDLYSKVIRIFSKLDTAKSPLRLQLLKQARHKIINFPENMFSTSILKQNVINILDTLIKIQLQNDTKMTKLHISNGRLKDKNNKLQRELKNLQLKPSTNNFTLNFESSKQLIEAMTIYCTVE